MATVKTVLATGGAGYVGSHCIVELLNVGFQVVVVDNFVNSVSDGSTKQAVSLKRVEKLTGKSIQFYQVDIIDKNQLDGVFKKHSIDCVIHFAALKNVREAISRPLDYYKNNLIGVLTLLDVMKEHNVKNLIFSSSCTVYGNSVYSRLPVVESDTTGQGIASPYGQSKYITEQILKDLCKADTDWNVVVLRYFNPVGAHSSGRIGENPKGVPKNLMPYVVQVAAGKLAYVPIFGGDFETEDGSAMRDFTHIMDVAEGHVAAINKIQDGFKVYNLGLGKGHTVLQMIAAMEKACEKKIPYQIQSRKPGDAPAVYCDANLAWKELGWKAKRGVEQMCADLWKWQCSNPLGYQENAKKCSIGESKSE